MASIKGFQLKNVKTPLGREGYGCTATMYLNGKKIGTYTDYGDGGCEEVEYVSSEAKEEMMKVVIAHAKENRNEYLISFYQNNPERYKEECERFRRAYPYIPEEDITIETMASNSIVYIVGNFLDLLEAEKQFKKYQKNGYRAICVEGNSITAFPASWSDEKIREKAGDEGDLYMSLDDFVK